MFTDSQTIVEPSFVKNYEELLAQLTRANPAYAQQVAFGRGGARFATAPKELYFYRETKRGIVVPRNCPEEWFTQPLPQSTFEGRKMKGVFCGRLRPYQATFIDTNRLDKLIDVVLGAPCGHGKTVMGIYRATKIGRATLVLVPTNTLVHQWMLRIKEATNATVACWYANKKEPDFNVDFLVMTSELLVSRKPDNRWCEQWGHVIWDEAHRAGAPSIVPTCEVLPGRYRTALTATFRRHDKMEQILAYHFGPAFMLPSQFDPAKIWQLRTKRRVYDSVPVAKIKQPEKFFDMMEEHGLKVVQYGENVAFVNEKHESSGKLVKSVMLKAAFKKEWRAVCNQNKTLPNKVRGGAAVFDTWQSCDANRIKQMRALLTRLLKSGRTVLFLSKRTRNLKLFYALFKDVVPTVLVMGGADKMTDKQEQFMQKEARLVLGIVQLAKEGLDCPRLDTLVCEHALSDLEQAVGRVERDLPGKKFPLAIVPQDTSGYYAGILQKGMRTLPPGTTLTGQFTLMELPKVLTKNA